MKKPTSVNTSFCKRFPGLSLLLIRTAPPLTLTVVLSAYGSTVTSLLPRVGQCSRAREEHVLAAKHLPRRRNLKGKMCSLGKEQGAMAGLQEAL